MAHRKKNLKKTFELLARHGYWVRFVNILFEQIGIPVPVLLGMGALVGMERFSFTQALLISVAACLISDSNLVHAEAKQRPIGAQGVLPHFIATGLVCAHDQGWFERLGSSALLFAKIVPCFSTVAQSMASANRIHPLRVLAMDSLGSAIWASAYFGLGFAFHDQAVAIWNALTPPRLVVGIGTSSRPSRLSGRQILPRTIYIRGLRGNRIAPGELRRRLDSDEPPKVLDLRRATEISSRGTTLPTARWVYMTRLRAN